jgi:hypothetical protein
MRIHAYPAVALLALLGAATLTAQAPWRVTIRLTENPLPIGTCHTVVLTAIDPVTRGTPRSESGHYLSVGTDFDLEVEAPAVGKWESSSIWLVCACQSATAGAQGTITATYPAKALPEKSRIPGVAFKTQAPFTFSTAQSRYNAAGCDALKPAAPVAVALPPTVAPVTLAPAPAPAALIGVPATPLKAPSTAGPPPQNVRVAPAFGGWPLIQALAWDPLPGVSGYNVSSKLNAAATQWTQANTGPLVSETFADSNFRQPGTMYRVTALYADGRQGSTDVVYTNPARLSVPYKFSARLLSPGIVRLSWSPVPIWGAGYCSPTGCLPPYIASYVPSRVMGPGQPADGTLVPHQTLYSTVDDQILDVSNLPYGTHTWQVTADYGGIYETAGLPTATITLTAPPPLAPEPRFRVSILGFKAILETNDDLLSRDGKNNEVYAAANVCVGTIGYLDAWDPKFPSKYLAWNYKSPTCSLIRSATHGDVNGFPGRVKAGSGSASGGITSGDVVGAGPSGTTSGSTSTFPFLLWEGTLLAGKDAVWIAPSLWEAGGVDLELDAWAARSTPANLNIQTGAAWQELGGGFVPMNQSIYHCSFDQGSDRAIGLVPAPYPNQPPGLPCLVIGLTRAKAEAVLASAPQEAGKPVGVLTMDLLDALSGHYVMYLKLERLP